MFRYLNNIRSPWSSDIHRPLEKDLGWNILQIDIIRTCLNSQKIHFGTIDFYGIILFDNIDLKLRVFEVIEEGCLLPGRQRNCLHPWYNKMHLEPFWNSS